MRTPRAAFGFLIAAAMSPCALAQSRPVRAATPLELQQRLTILDLEDRRAPDVEIAPRIAGSELLSSEIQRLLVRMLGRLERPSQIPSIALFLKSRFFAVRAEAARALAQSLHVEHPPPAHVELVQRHLLDALSTVQSDAVRLEMLHSLAHLPYSAAQQVQAAEAAILAVLREAERSRRSDEVREAMYREAAIALESLIRRHRVRHPPSDETIARLRGILSSHVQYPTARPPALAALVAAAAVDVDLIDRALGDPVDEVRRLAARALRPFAAERPDLIDHALRDRRMQVRLEALRAYGAKPFDGCGRFLDALSDTSDHVVLQAIDLLGGPCTSDENVAEILGGFMVNVPQLRGWHRAAHAIVALAKRDPPRAAEAMATVSQHSAWQVRMYAARAAAVLKDAERLKIFADDDNDNVRHAALAGLHPLLRHEGDEIYLANLKRRDYQLLMMAATALDGTPKRAPAAAALFDALARVTADERETSRDVRLALLQRLREVGDPFAAERLRAYLTDFDPRIAVEAADLYAAWTGTRPIVQPRALPRLAIPTQADLDALWGRCAKVRMKWAGEFCLIFKPDVAPMTVFRFVRLVQSGYYDGLTFHRVEPNFVIQGGSPGANEYAGADRYWRDEVGASNLRGTVGVSTRGRDTGDAQIFINLADNLRLDHDYTVFASVVELNDGVLDKILEGDTIERVEIVPLLRQ